MTVYVSCRSCVPGGQLRDSVIFWCFQSLERECTVSRLLPSSFTSDQQSHLKPERATSDGMTRSVATAARPASPSLAQTHATHMRPPPRPAKHHPQNPGVDLILLIQPVLCPPPQLPAFVPSAALASLEKTFLGELIHSCCVRRKPLVQT